MDPEEKIEELENQLAERDRKIRELELKLADCMDGSMSSDPKNPGYRRRLTGCRF